jgi:DNA-binding NarL/FixJ family response regulator
MIRIALFQPRIYQDTLSFFFNNTDGFCVVANLNYQNVEKQLKASQPHVVLMDIALDIDLLVLSRIRKHDSLIRVVILSEKNDPATLTMCLKMKVSGYLLSNRMALSELAECVRVTREGGFPMHPSLIGEVVKMLEYNKSPFSDTYFEDLTERQNEILKLIVNGLTYKSISQELCISLDTVRTHIRNIYYKLGVNSKAQAMAKALHLELYQ